MGELRVINSSGDQKIMWDRNKSIEVEMAEETFDKLTKKGYMAFEIKKNGKPGEKVTKFDPDLELLILTPPVMGG